MTPIEDDFVLENSSSDQGHLQGQAFISLTYTTYFKKIRENKKKLVSFEKYKLSESSTGRINLHDRHTDYVLRLN